MAEPANFPQSNAAFSKPPNMTHDECESLCVYVSPIASSPLIVSCWKLTRDELDEVNVTGRIWVHHHSTGLPPHSVSGHNPWEQSPEYSGSKPLREKLDE